MKKALFLSLLFIAILSACKTSKTNTASGGTPATKEDVIIPTVFTPNGDGENDFACFLSIKKEVKAQIQIFNRWGEKLWESENIKDCWDGLNTKTKQAYESGVYFVIIESNGVLLLTGSLTLIR